LTATSPFQVKWHRERFMIGQRSLPSVLVVALSLLASASFGQGAPRFVITPDKANGTYAVGEKIRWSITGPVSDGNICGFKIKRNNQDVIATGSVTLVDGKGTLEFSGGEPEMLYGELTPPNGRGAVFGAAVAPADLKPVVSKPADFDRFWRGKIADLKKIPENAVVTDQDSGRPDVNYATIRMDHVNGTHVYGQIAWPKKPGKHPAMLQLQWASPPYPLQRSWVVDRAAEGWIALNIEPHDVLPTEGPAYYAALPNALKNYNVVGQDDREKSYFVEMYLRDYRGVDYLTERPDWDGKTLLVTGTSMGGQQSLCVAGLHPRITHVIVEEPAGCDLNASLHGRQMGYPNFNASDPKVMETARYVDAVNFASHIHATTLVAMGYVDNVAPPAGIWTAFNLVRGRKEVAPMPLAPHNNTATYEQQKPYFTRNGAWLTALAHGDRVPVP